MSNQPPPQRSGVRRNPAIAIAIGVGVIVAMIPVLGIASLFVGAGVGAAMFFAVRSRS